MSEKSSALAFNLPKINPKEKASKPKGWHCDCISYKLYSSGTSIVNIGHIHAFSFRSLGKYNSEKNALNFFKYFLLNLKLLISVGTSGCNFVMISFKSSWQKWICF